MVRLRCMMVERLISGKSDRKGWVVLIYLFARGTYCALSVAVLTNLLTPELTKNAAEFICKAQTYEGGIDPFPGKEAHNGYTFCGLAAIEILGSMAKLDVNKLTVPLSPARSAQKAHL